MLKHYRTYVPAYGNVCEVNFAGTTCQTDLPAVHNVNGIDMCAYHSPYDVEDEVIADDDDGYLILADD
jgi:hypothetical protein